MSRAGVVAAVLLAIAACGEIPRPFAPEYKGESNALLMPLDRAGVVVKPVAGLPDGAAFAEALAEGLRAEGVAAMTGRGNSASLVLRGEALADADGWDVVLALDDARGAALGSIVSRIPAGSWVGHAPTMARSIVAVLHPDGPVIVPPKPAVTIGAVTGVPGDGGRALARALEFNLRRARVDLADRPDKATHTVTAAVTIAPPRGTPGSELQHIDVRWTVVAAGNREVGQIRQANDVPARAVDRNWAEIAYTVADAAVESIADLLTRPPPRAP